MTTQDVIAKVEAIGQSFAVVMKEHGMTSVCATPSDLRDIPLPVFVEVCEHYKSEPNIGQWPTAWIAVNGMSLYVQCEHVNAAPVKMDALTKLRELVTTAKAA